MLGDVTVAVAGDVPQLNLEEGNSNTLALRYGMVREEENPGNNRPRHIRSQRSPGLVQKLQPKDFY